MSSNNELIRQARKLGLTVSKAKSNHWRVSNSRGQTVTVAGTPSDQRGKKNALSDFRRLVNGEKVEEA